MEAIKPYFKLFYNGTNITEDISQYLLDISYTDKVTGESDELEIRLEDKDGHWSNEWYPDKGAVLKIEFGYNNGKTVTPNDFQLDEIELTGDKSSGDLVSLKGLSAGITSKLRTKRSYAHENKTLAEIITTVAARIGYTVIGNISKIVIGRVTQHREKDITFIHRLASEYGYNFTIKGKKLVFVLATDIETKTKVLTIDKTDCLSWSIKDKSTKVYQSATVRYKNPNQNKVIESTQIVEATAVNHQSYGVFNNYSVDYGFLKDGEKLEIRTKTETQQQAIVKAATELHKFNSLAQTGEIIVQGNILLLAGNNIELTGFGRNSGIWHILKSRHSISKSSGYLTSCELKKVVPSSVSGSKRKPNTVPSNNSDYSVR